MRTRTLFTVFAILLTLLSACKKNDDEQEMLPQPSFTYSGESMAAPATVTFLNQSQNAVSFSWEFGDGSISEEIHPVHEFLSSGTYSVQLTATNEHGSTDFTQEVTINEPLPVALFTVDQDSVPAPATFTFQNGSQDASTYQWNFGDGASSTDENPEHTYEHKGVYEVQLTASGPGGQDVFTKQVVVLDPANILPGSSAGPFSVLESWGSITTKVSTSYYWHTMLYIGGYYYHLCTFEDDGISFFFRTSRSSMSSSDQALVLTVFDPFTGFTDKGITFGSTVDEVIAAYGPAVDEKYETIYYDAIGIDFGYDDARLYIEDISVYEPSARKSTRGELDTVRMQISNSKGTYKTL